MPAAEDKWPVSPEHLQKLVDAFYARIRADEQLGPIFNNAVTDWEQHLEKLGQFWCSVMLSTGSYSGQPLPAHVKHARVITPALFDRWLWIWGDVTNTHMQPLAAAHLQHKAARIAQSLQLGIQYATNRRP